MFKINDYLVFKKDVCKVKKIKQYNNEDYYILTPISDESLTINVPVSNKFNQIRSLITKEEVLNIIKEIPHIEEIKVQDRQIEQEYKSLLQNANHKDLIKIIKTAYSRNQKRLDENKKIGEKDNNYFNLAEKYLYTEFSIVLNMSYDETKEYVVNEVKKLTN